MLGGADVGIVGVRFFYNGDWTTCFVDEYFPVSTQHRALSTESGAVQCRYAGSSDAGMWIPIYARARDDKEYWVLVVERAFAKMHGDSRGGSGL